MNDDPVSPLSSLRRGVKFLRALASADASGTRLIDLANLVGCNQPTAHRALQDLMAEGLVEQVPGSKRYRLGLEFFTLAASANKGSGLRDLARPVLLRLSATLSDTVFLLVRSVYDAVCLDRVEGPFPIRSFTGDIGGKVPLGLGQGGVVILAHLPEDEREAVIRYNMPRLLDRGYLDEAAFRSVLVKTRQDGFVTFNSGLIPGMAGVAVPVFDARGYVIAAISIGTLSDRLKDDRLSFVVSILKAEAEQLSKQVNPFDPALRTPSRALSVIP
jgi:DNA-binding IclR family transcriptional regulator